VKDSCPHALDGEPPLNGRLLWILYRHELRSSLRAKNIVVSSILIPLVMYPLLMWAIFAGVTLVQGQQEGQEVRLAVVGDAGAPELMEALGALDRVRLLAIDPDDAPAAAQARTDLLEGRLDGILSFVGTGSPEIRLEIHEGRSRSRQAEVRIAAVLSEERARIVADARTELGIDPARWEAFRLVREDQSSSEDRTRLLLALLVPVFTVVIVALASFYPAIDSTAGERERSTWETLMTLSVSRRTMVWAKFLHVATLGAVGGLLNLVALSLSLRWILAPLAGDELGELGGIGLPLGVIPVLLLGTAILALLVAALMLVFTVFARTFKEGQAMVSPVYMLLILPPVLVVQPDMDLEASSSLALVPVINTVLLFRHALLGDLTLALALTAFASMLATALLATAFAQWVMGREEVLAGATEGGLVPFLRGHLRQRTRKGASKGKDPAAPPPMHR
jgi:sodium transport system permease protein